MKTLKIKVNFDELLEEVKDNLEGTTFLSIYSDGDYNIGSVPVDYQDGRYIGYQSFDGYDYEEFEHDEEFKNDEGYRDWIEDCFNATRGELEMKGYNVLIYFI